jgi:hypothetical protein
MSESVQRLLVGMTIICSKFNYSSVRKIFDEFVIQTEDSQPDSTILQYIA